MSSPLLSSSSFPLPISSPPSLPPFYTFLSYLASLAYHAHLNDVRTTGLDNTSAANQHATSVNQHSNIDASSSSPSVSTSPPSSYQTRKHKRQRAFLLDTPSTTPFILKPLTPVPRFPSPKCVIYDSPTATPSHNTDVQSAEPLTSVLSSHQCDVAENVNVVDVLCSAKEQKSASNDDNNITANLTSSFKSSSSTSSSSSASLLSSSAALSSSVSTVPTSSNPFEVLQQCDSLVKEITTSATLSTSVSNPPSTFSKSRIRKCKNGACMKQDDFHPTVTCFGEACLAAPQVPFRTKYWSCPKGCDFFQCTSCYNRDRKHKHRMIWTCKCRDPALQTII